MSKLFLLPVVVLFLLTPACSRDAQYYLERGNQLAGDGKPDDAILMYRKAVQKDGKFGEAYYQLGSILWRIHKTQEAFSMLTRAAALLPGRADVKAKLADLELTSYLSDPRHPGALYDKVAILSGQLLAANALSYDGLRLKADLAAAGKDYKGAEELYGRANQVKPLQPEVVLGWTEVLFADDRAKEAEQLALQLISAQKTYSPVYDLLYRHYLAEKRVGDAENILKMKAANNPRESTPMLELAAYYAAANREEEMKTAVQHMLDNPGTFPDARLQSGDLYVRLQRWDDALQQYEEGAQLDPKRRVDYLKRIADIWLAQGKGEQAARVVDEILKQLPKDPSARGVRASLLLASGKPDDVAKAASDLKTLVDQNPKNAVWHFNLGRALAAKGDLEGARVRFQEAVNLQKGFLPPRLALLDLAQARHDYKASLLYSGEILTVRPNLVNVQVVHAVSLMYTGKDQAAQAEFAALERSAPADPEVQMQVAVMELHEKKFSEAEAGFRKLMAKADGDHHKVDTRAINGLVDTLAAEHQPDRAIAALEDELKNSPDSIPVRSILARTAALEGKYDIAVEQYRQMLAAAPNSEPTCLALGITYRMKGDFPNAIAFLQRARSLDPKDPAPLIRLGGVLGLTGRRPEALALYRDALKLKPEDAATWSNAGYLIAETGGNLDEAMKFAQKAVQLDAGQPDYTDTLGWIYLRKHVNDNAIQIFRSLTRKYPDGAAFHYHLGLALLQQGNREAARAELKTALAGKLSDEVRRNVETALADMNRG